MEKDYKWYVVWVGRQPGVYNSWEECQEMVDGFPGAQYKAFPSQERAINAFRGKPEDHMGILRGIASHKAAKVVNYEAIPEIDIKGIAVDASCMGNPGIMEYQGVAVATGTQIFKVGPYKGGTNNIGEYLAIVHALALFSKSNPLLTIYSDSKTAISWIRRRHSNTNIARNAVNAPLLDLLERADRWIQAHSFSNPIVKWRTEEWGEIPADFGRK